MDTQSKLFFFKARLKIFYRLLVIIGLANAILITISAVIMEVIIFLVMMGRNVTGSAIESFAKGYLRFVFAGNPAVATLSIISLLSLLLFILFRKNNDS